MMFLMMAMALMYSLNPVGVKSGSLLDCLVTKKRARRAQAQPVTLPLPVNK